MMEMMCFEVTCFALSPHNFYSVRGALNIDSERAVLTREWCLSNLKTLHAAAEKVLWLEGLWRPDCTSSIEHRCKPQLQTSGQILIS